MTAKTDPKTDPIAVVCTMTVFAVPSGAFLLQNSREIHDAMLRAATEAVETLAWPDAEGCDDGVA
jgi:hypothetical protein